MSKLDIKKTKDGTNFYLEDIRKNYPTSFRIFLHKDDYKTIDPKGLQGILEGLIKFFNP